MLRWIVGDDAFFAACRDYLDKPGTAFAFGSTAEFQAYLEQRGGKDLDEFFRDWFYGEGWPAYAVRWSAEPDSLILWLDQTPSHPSVDFFDMPVPVQVFSGGQDTMLRLDHAYNGQRFAIDLGGMGVDSVKFDPELRLLSRNNTVTEITTAVEDPQTGGVLLIYPNPASSLIHIHPSTGVEGLELMDATGRAIRLNAEEGQVDISGMAPGVYGVRPLGSRIGALPAGRILILH
jgi:hypothetical protein